MKFQFPTHLRKMWSGTEVQQWLDEQVQPVKQEPVAWKETVRALTDQCAALVWERDELQKQVQRYERNGVTCQLYGHKVERSCSECNDDKNYAAPVSCATSCPDAKAIRAEELEETKEIAKTIGGSFADEFLAAIRGMK